MKRIGFGWGYFAVYARGRWRFLYWSQLVPLIVIPAAIFLTGFLLHAGWSWQP